MCIVGSFMMCGFLNDLFVFVFCRSCRRHCRRGWRWFCGVGGRQSVVIVFLVAVTNVRFDVVGVLVDITLLAMITL